ncbi:hypothetical protein [Photobacterium sp. GB-72]|uniref:hypothetical protein n=1 Tax=Photobacterium sp. GB-72 TaxID=2022105 RepID=UPI0011B238F0|nr:hypothetical protein [Photobacterium sp. GB-72]
MELTSFQAAKLGFLKDMKMTIIADLTQSNLDHDLQAFKNTYQRSPKHIQTVLEQSPYLLANSASRRMYEHRRKRIRNSLLTGRPINKGLEWLLN